MNIKQLTTVKIMKNEADWQNLSGISITLLFVKLNACLKFIPSEEEEAIIESFDRLGQ